MHSPNIPAPDLRDRVLALTLARVRRRRAQRHRIVAVTASLALAAVSLSWWVHRTSSQPEGLVLLSQETAPASVPVMDSIHVEHLAERPLSLIERSSHTSNTVERLAGTPRGYVRVTSLTDEQLLASLPAEQPAALVKNPDGTSKLYVLQ